jgi:hypothetical protein
MCLKPLAFLQGLVISFAVIGGATSSANAQCVPDTLSVTSVSGRVIAKFNDGEGPLTKAFVTLKRGDNFGPVIAKQVVKEDGSFEFSHIEPGKYQMMVSEPGLINFYLDLQVRRSKATKDQKEIIVIMGADFRKECSGSFAELRVKERRVATTASALP